MSSRSHLNIVVLVGACTTWAVPNVSAAEEIRASSVGTDASATSSDGEQPTRKKKKKKKTETAEGTSTSAPRASPTPLRVTTSLAALAGGFTGYQIRPDGGAALVLQAQSELRYRRGDFDLEAPLTLRHRQTLGTSLSETYGALVPQASYEFGRRLDLLGTLGVRFAFRPGWVDPYDPVVANGQPTGDLQTSHRMSHVDWLLGLGVKARPARKTSTWARYDFVSADYATSDSFDAIDRPTHLVPSDYVQHMMELGWRYAADAWRITGTLEVGRKAYGYSFARDAGTGVTHAGAGGPPPNPLLTFNIARPSVTFESWLVPETLRAGAGYGVSVQSDTYAGYYSSVSQEPSLWVEYRMAGGASIKARGQIRWQRYGADSYEVNPPDHPDLDYGTRRIDKRADARIDARWPITRQLDAISFAALHWRDTNFPDYVPGTFPQGGDYQIDWDFTDFEVYAGVEYRFVGRWSQEGDSNP